MALKLTTDWYPEYVIDGLQKCENLFCKIYIFFEFHLKIELCH